MLPLSGENTACNATPPPAATVQPTSESVSPAVGRASSPDGALPSTPSQPTPTAPAELVQPTATIQAPLETPVDPNNCCFHLELIDSLKTTIEVLEAELLCLRKSNEAEKRTVEETKWTTVRHSSRRNQPSSNPSGNKHHILDTGNKTVTSGKRGKNHKSSKAIVNTTKQKIRLRYKQLEVESDSHGRHIAGLLLAAIDGPTKVTGICKPAARLSSIVPSHPPSSGTCRVIVAGTNDVAAGLQANLYNNLESSLRNIPPTSGILVASLPFRHDLHPNHPVNEETLFVNSFVTKLCARYPRVEMVDINRIGRTNFTSHGMHLRMRGKRRLAELILEGAQRLQQRLTLPSAADCGEHKSPPRGSSSATRTVVSLPHDSYAEAVRGDAAGPVSDGLSPDCEVECGLSAHVCDGATQPDSGSVEFKSNFLDVSRKEWPGLVPPSHVRKQTTV